MNILAYDRLFPGALCCIKKMKEYGARVKFFTGRDEPSMSLGTKLKLHENQLFDDLTMKPDKDIPDQDFKIQYFESITKSHSLVCFSENELRNLQPFLDTYPGALFIWLDTLHSPNQPKKDERILRMTNWLLDN